MFLKILQSGSISLNVFSLKRLWMKLELEVRAPLVAHSLLGACQYNNTFSSNKGKKRLANVKKHPCLFPENEVRQKYIIST
jgi:hypothetical protein